MMDIKDDAKIKWIGAQTRVVIKNLNTIAIYTNSDYVEPFNIMGLHKTTPLSQILLHKSCSFCTIVKEIHT
jgi:hypothetical protein